MQQQGSCMGHQTLCEYSFLLCIQVCLFTYGPFANSGTGYSTQVCLIHFPYPPTHLKTCLPLTNNHAVCMYADGIVHCEPFLARPFQGLFYSHSLSDAALWLHACTLQPPALEGTISDYSSDVCAMAANRDILISAW